MHQGFAKLSRDIVMQATRLQHKMTKEEFKYTTNKIAAATKKLFSRHYSEGKTDRLL